MKLKYFVDTKNYILYVSNKHDMEKTKSISTKSTAINIMYYPGKLRLVDILIGTQYIDNSYKVHNISVRYKDNWLIIDFAKINLNSTQDLFEGENEEEINQKVKIYLHEWDITRIEIRKDFLELDQNNDGSFSLEID